MSASFVLVICCRVSIFRFSAVADAKAHAILPTLSLSLVLVKSYRLFIKSHMGVFVLRKYATTLGRVLYHCLGTLFLASAGNSSSDHFSRALTLCPSCPYIGLCKHYDVLTESPVIGANLSSLVCNTDFFSLGALLLSACQTF